MRLFTLAAALVLGSIPFALLGIALGYWASPRGALPVANLLLSDVPGPLEPRFLLGRRVLACYPMLPLPGTVIPGTTPDGFASS